MTVGQFKIQRLQTKLETYERSLDYLTKWCNENQDLSLKISKWLSDNSDKLDIKQLKLVTQYHIEKRKKKLKNNCHKERKIIEDVDY